MKWSRPFKWVICSIGLVAALSASLVLYEPYDKAHAEWNRKQIGSPFDEGKSVLAALAYYKQDHGSYPYDLGALIPQYLSSIPQPHWGLKHWEYMRNPLDGQFTLS